MRLDRRQVKDVFADEPPRNHETVAIHLIENQEPVGEVPDRVANVDPLLVAFVEVDVAQPVGLDHRELLVLAFAELGVDDDRPVVTRVNQYRTDNRPASSLEPRRPVATVSSTSRERRNATRC